jgi:hypothetical protein
MDSHHSANHLSTNYNDVLDRNRNCRQATVLLLHRARHLLKLLNEIGCSLSNMREPMQNPAQTGDNGGEVQLHGESALGGNGSAKQLPPKADCEQK